MLILVLSVLVIFVLAFWYWYTESAENEPPLLPNNLPFIGHGHLLLGGRKKILSTIENISNECTKMGGVIKLYIGPQIYYGATDPEDCFTIANTCLEKSKIYDFFKPWIGEGLIAGDVVTWKKHRKLLNPVFHQEALNSYIGIFNSQSRRLVNTLTDKVGENFDPQAIIKSNNFKTVCMTSTGVIVDDHDFSNNYYKCFDEMLSIGTQRIAHIWLHINCIYNLTTLKLKQDRSVKTMYQYSDFIMETNKKEINKTNEPLKANHEYENKEILDSVKPFMKVILEISNKTNCLTDEEIREETHNLIVAAYESTTNTLGFALILLGSYSDVQDKVYKEILKVIGDKDRDVTKDDLSQLVYIEAVLKETMRLYPIAPILSRRIHKEIKLKNYTLKPRNDCALSIWGLHRHEVWGPDADQFRPERWLEPDTLPDLKYHYAAFSLGRRNCIGKVYAMMSMKISLVHLMRKYKIKSDITKLVLMFDVLLKPESGHQIHLELR